MHRQPGIADALASHERSRRWCTGRGFREAELVVKLYEAADAVEGEDVWDEVYKAITAALEVWAPESLERAQAGELRRSSPNDRRGTGRVHH